MEELIMSNEPRISWYEGENKKENEIKDKSINYGTVESDDDSNQKVFYIWNNRNGDDDVSKMEEVTFTTKDRDGGTGDTEGNIVEVVRDNWIQVRVDSLNEQSFTAVGKDHAKPVGTNGSTTNPKHEGASTWGSGITYSVGDYVLPTVANDYMYRVTTPGTTGGDEPSWSLTAGNVVTDGTVEYATVPIKLTPAAQEILGVANNVKEDGSDAENGGGNFIKLTTYASVPVDASSGLNLFSQRMSYRYV